MSRVKLARSITVEAESVEVVRTVSDRIPANSYQGWIHDSTAVVSGENSFRVSLPTNFRRPVTCQVIVAPGTATVIPRPTVLQAFGLLCQSIEVRPVNGSHEWNARARIALDCGEEISYTHSAGSYYAALSGAADLALKCCADWYDPDPLSPDPGDILEVPIAKEPDPTSEVQ